MTRKDMGISHTRLLKIKLKIALRKFMKRFDRKSKPAAPKVQPTKSTFEKLKSLICRFTPSFCK